jgi:hypothetical protein
MAVVVSENYQSRPFEIGPQMRRELVYDCQCLPSDDEEAVRLAIEARAPVVYLGLVIDNIVADPVTDVLWKGRVRYKRLQAEPEYTFDSSGGTQKITQSIATVSYGLGGGGAPNFNGAIGVSEDKVEGADITVPNFQFSETHFFSDSSMVAGYKHVIYALTGTINNAPFKGLDTGECLFMGASGTRRPGDLQWAVTFRFAGSMNQPSLTVGPIGGITKGGWDYMWVRYGDFADATNYALVKRPIAVYVETVYYSSDFSTLLIGI